MGSVSGALAGEAGNSMVVGGDFFWGDSTPTEAAENGEERDKLAHGLEPQNCSSRFSLFMSSTRHMLKL